MKKIVIVLFLLIVAGAGIGLYYYYKPHQSIAKEKPEFSVSAAQLVSDFEKNETEANQKYNGKVVEITGPISEKATDPEGKLSVTIAGAEIAGVNCQIDPEFTSKLTNAQEGETLRLKGICTGILMDVVMVDCVPVQ